MEDSDYEDLPTERVSVHLIAGGLAGMMEHCVMYPVDCVKVGKLFCRNENVVNKGLSSAMTCSACSDI